MISILITAALLAQQTSTHVVTTNRVEGSVINSLNGEAVAKATVILRAHDEEHGQSYADETDGNGNFAIDDVQPGQYAVIAQRPGYSIRSAGATGAPPAEITVQKGQSVNNVKVQMMPLAVIAGRIFEADGDPARGVTVMAMRYVYSAGTKQLQSVEQVQTGDKGDFRLFGLRAGTFYLKAIVPRQGPSGPESLSTYYPGTPDEGHAMPLAVRPGGQLQGFDIRLQSAARYSVRFALPVGLTPENGFGAFLMNEQGVQQDQVVSFDQTGLVFAGVPPGSYEAVVNLFKDGKQSYAAQHVDVFNADVNGGTLAFLPPVEVTGSVRVEGGTFRDFGKLRVNLRPPHPLTPFGNVSAGIKPDGSFELNNAVPAGVHEVVINRIPGLYLKSVLIGDKQLADRRIDLASKLEPLTIVLGTDVGKVEGSVQNAMGDPVARARVNVIAYVDQSSRNDFNRFGFTNEKGEFKIKDVPPGEYKVFAWEDVPVGAPQDPEFRKPFEKQAASIRMQPNGNEKVSLTAIAAAQVDRSSQ